MKVSSRWASAHIGEVCQVNPPRDGVAASDLSVSFVPMSAVEAGTGNMSPTEERLNGDMRKSTYRAFAEGDVLFAKITPCMENGKCGVARGLKNGLGYGSTEFHVLRCGEKIDARYLMHYLLQASFRSEARAHMTGTAGQLRVPAAFMRDTRIPMPPLDEQRRIVETIEEHFSHLDAAEASLGLAGKAAVALRERRYQEILQAGWPTVKLAQIAKTSSSGTPSRDHAENYGPPHRWIKSGELGDSVVKSTEESITKSGLESSSAKLLRRGTLLMAMYGATIGRLGIVGMDAAATNQAVCAIEPHDVRLVPWLWLCLRALRATLIASGKGGAQLNISQGIIRNLDIPIPPDSVRESLAACIERDVDMLVRVEQVLSVQRQRSQLLRRAILSRSFRQAAVMTA